ncbi:HesB/YadR/YfhF family protein [Alkalibacillus haloalkaliphilus]|uniref:HesB/YadR/YfhF family protein n=1 Tax=Alkalibacillus haloalkaliphilus TaxID=94136 RepID=UPI0002D6AA61|nr:hypothetical protein [Alkalibacillus haloalkaliphilus]
MEIHVTEQAVDWFYDEMDLETGDVVNFFPKYGGTCSFQKGFSIGMAIGRAQEPEVETEKKGVTFQIDEKDVWFFDGKDLYIGLKDGEVEYSDGPIE